MYLIYSKKIFLSSPPAIFVKLTTIIIAMFFLGQTKAQSQTQKIMDHNHPNVTVDLSVISGKNNNQSSNVGSFVLPSQSNRKLLRPGSQSPRSMLHVPAAKNETSPQLKKKIKNKIAPKSMLHVSPANTRSTLQTMDKGETEVSPIKNITKPKKKIDIAAVEPTKKAPTTSTKVTSPAKALPLKPEVSSKAPKKLQAKTNPVSGKPTSAPAVKLKQTAPPSTPAIKAAPEIKKKLLPTPPTSPIAEKKPTNQQASIAPKEDLTSDIKTLRVSFSQDQTKLPVSAKKSLISLAESLKGTVNQRIQLMAYAGGPSLSSSLARRMSLSRALAIRSFLIEKGVRSTRIDVRALGNKTTEEPLNRVDLKVTER